MNKPEEISDPEVQKPKHDGRWRPHIIGMTILCILLLMLIGFFPRYYQKEKIDQAAERKPPIPVVKVMEALPNRKNVEIELPSYLQAINITPIWARVDGYIKMFYVDIGDRLKVGQLMVDIDTPEVDQQLAQARAELERFKALMEIARITTERWQTLWNKNPEAISLQEVEEKAANYQSAAANVQAGIANVQRLEALQGFNKVYAPFEGVVIKRNIDIGSLVTAGSNGSIEQLYQVAKTDVIRAFIDVPQPYFRLIKDGMKAEITVNEYPDKVFTGVVARNSSALAQLARTLLTQVNIDNTAGDLLVGLYAQVKLVLSPDIATFIIPTSSLIIRSGPTYVGIVGEDGKVRMQKVEVGLNYGKNVEILSGLKEKDRIILNPTEKIKEGVAVEIAS